MEKNRNINFILNHRKGFTLMELIVVLVILAILAAVAIPVMLGFTDSAKEKKYTEEANRALSAAETMLSDVYTDNLKYVPRRMRAQAANQADLPGSEFTIYTVDRFKDTADGTINSIAAYTIAAALYKTSDGQYLYYDGNSWEMIDSNDSHVLNAKSGNYIDVWPDTEYLADSAGNAEKDDEQGSEGEEPKYTTENDEKEQDRNTEHITEEEEDVTLPDEGVIIPVVIRSDNRSVYFANNPEKHVVEDARFSGNKGFKMNPNPKVNSVYYDPDSMTFSYESIDGSMKSVNYSGLVSYLYQEAKKYKPEDDIPEYIFHASAKENTISIPLVFRAFNDKTLGVSLSGEEGNGSITVDYGMITKLSTEDISLSDVTVSNYSNPSVSFVNKWYIEDKNGYIEGKYGTASTDEELLGAIDNWVISNLNTINPEGTMTVAQMEEAGLTFVASADIAKSVYVRGTLTNAGLLKGEVTFENGDQPIQMLKKDFIRNEKTEELYTLNGDERGERVSFSGEQSYSLFRDNAILVNGDPLNVSSKQVNCWRMYQSGKNYVITDDITYMQKVFGGMDRTEDILDQLYKSSSYGEVAEIVVSGTNVLLNSEITEANGYTPIREYFSGLVGGLGNINAILFTDPDTPERFSERDKEVCISKTQVLPASNPTFSGQLECVGVKYVVDPNSIEPDYPSYAVAYRVKDTNKKYTIYVVTEDGTDMKAVGSYAGLHNGCTAMTENTFVSHLETSEVTSMQEMFYNCKTLTKMNIDQFDYTGVSSMYQMFYNCYVLPSNVVQMVRPSNSGGVNCNYMFYDCNALTEIQGFDITYATSIKGLFKSCDALKSVVLKGSGTESDSVACMIIGSPGKNDGSKEVFTDAGTTGFKLVIKDVLFSGYNYSNSRNQTGTQRDWGFYELIHSATNVSEVELNNLSFPNVYTFDFLLGSFANNAEDINDKTACEFAKLKKVKLIDIDGKFQRMKGLFRNDKCLESVVIRGVNTSYLWNFSLAFQGCYNLKTIEFGEGFTTLGDYARNNYGNDSRFWTDFNRTFEKCYSLSTIIGLDRFDTSYAKTFTLMFNSCYSLQTLDLTGFSTQKMTKKVKVSNVERSPFYRMFWTDTIPESYGLEESRLRTIYATDAFVVHDAFVSLDDMFGDKLNNLAGGQGTNMSNTDGTKKQKAYYAWIDGKTTSTRTDSKGYFTSSVYKETTLGQTNGNWEAAGLRSGVYNTITSFQRGTTVYEKESDFLAFWNSLPEESKFMSYADDSSVGVYFWLDGTSLYWWSKAGTVYVNENTSNMFMGWDSLSSISFDGLDTSKMSNMSLMFKGCTSLTELDLSSFKTNQLSSIQGMFSGCTNLTKVYVDPLQWNRIKYSSSSTALVGPSVFEGCDNLRGGCGTEVVAHGIKVTDVYPDTTVDTEEDIDLYLSSYYAICDEPEDNDLNENGIEHELGYFTDIAQKP